MDYITIINTTINILYDCSSVFLVCWFSSTRSWPRSGRAHLAEEMPCIEALEHGEFDLGRGATQHEWR